MRNTPSINISTIKGNLERITYYNDQTHYIIAKFRADETGNLFSILGFLPFPNVGETLKISGMWETHPQYGQQFKFKSFQVLLPSTLEGIIQYIKSSPIKGIGSKLTRRIVDHFKEKTIDIIEKHPERLSEIDGIGKIKASHLSKAWEEHHLIRIVMDFLQKNLIKPSFGPTLLNIYGDGTMDVLRKDPYRIADDIPGYGFVIADTLMQNSGISKDDPKRIRSCVLHIMERSTEDGHTFILKDQVVKRCKASFGIESNLTKTSIKDLVDSQRIVMEKIITGTDDFSVGLYLKDLYKAETGIAEKILAMNSMPIKSLRFNPKAASLEILKRLAIRLSPEQLSILKDVLSLRISIITGGPGTGKTTLIRSIATIYQKLGYKVVLAAPTGRAARRLSEVTRNPAFTLHKLLDYRPQDGIYLKNQDNQLDIDLLIVDEASMVDTLLMFNLMKAIHLMSSLIFVGDTFQLPAVGPGNVLSDMIKSKQLKTFELKAIFRQAEESPIVVNAHKVRNGESLDLHPLEVSDELSEFYFIEQNHSGKIVDLILELCLRRIPDRFHFSPVEDIQVLTPMHKGLTGTIHLNQVLQRYLNKNGIAIEYTAGIYKPGDKVMHLKNNYQKDVFNGDIGTIKDIYKEKKRICVSYYGRIVDYEFSELDELSLAYAISVHKAQGSEYPVVIIPLVMEHYALLQRNLLYTAITRGKNLVVILGSKKALSMALRNDKPQKRLSNLSARLGINYPRQSNPPESPK